MQYVNGISSLYIRKFKRKLEQFNKPMKLPDYFGPMIGEKKSVDIAEVGAGPINTIGNEWPGVDVRVWASDVLQQEYEKLWQEHKAIPVVDVSCEDMEKLTYPDEYFDIVHCVNALDHTKDAQKALAELERVCKPGGWIYLRHAPNQWARFGGHHYWNINIERWEGKDECWFHDKHGSFKLDEKYKVHLEGDLIVAICQKT